MIRTFTSDLQWEKYQNQLWQEEELLQAEEAFYLRFEALVHRAAQVRDEIRRGECISEETIDVSFYAWTQRLLYKMSYMYELPTIQVGEQALRVIADLREKQILTYPVLDASRLAEDYAKETGYSVGVDTTLYRDEYLDQVSHSICTARSSVRGFGPHKLRIMCDKRQNPVLIVRSDRKRVVAFDEVDSAHAYREAKADRSYMYWKCVSDVAFKKRAIEEGIEFSSSMPIHLEDFTCVYRVSSLRKLEGEQSQGGEL